ncbi:hypothetical protein RintRC_4212 [Richelia intracellularis]|nr:hypothetical protein RintRC_4212 [Richelia intracellularis]
MECGTEVFALGLQNTERILALLNQGMISLNFQGFLNSFKR